MKDFNNIQQMMIRTVEQYEKLFDKAGYNLLKSSREPLSYGSKFM